jgi:trk system potassium uptake protein
MEPQSQRKLGNKVYRVPRIMPWEIPIKLIPIPRTHSGVSLFELVRGFAFIILAGAAILMFPFCSVSGTFTNPIDAIFMSTSAVCVTGLTPVDVANHFNFFGQLVLLILCQLGGFGYMTSATVLLMTFGRKIGLKERLLIGESLGVEPMGGLVQLVRMMAFFTLIVEGLGAIILFICFLPGNTVLMALWKAVFHSISAFNNCGIDIMGNYQSIIGYQNNPVVILTHALLIITGGISFMVVRDMFRKKRLISLSLDTKMVLVMTGCLLAFGTIVIFFAEYNNMGTMGNMSLVDKVVNSFFQATTPRTAGFNSVDIGQLMTVTQLFMIFLMFVGGAAGSTTGGIKVNTFGILIFTIWSVLRRKQYVGAFGREFRDSDIYRAISVALLAITIIILMTALMSIFEPESLKNILFEVVSAMGTVGLSTGITPNLTSIGKILIILTMFIGRLGPLTFIISMVRRKQTALFRYPEESVRIG